MIKNLLLMIKNNILYPFGASMSLVGVPLGMYLNQMVGSIRWSPVTMVLSVVMLMNWLEGRIIS